jgi:hypothetical protein
MVQPSSLLSSFPETLARNKTKTNQNEPSEIVKESPAPDATASSNGPKIVQIVHRNRKKVFL